MTVTLLLGLAIVGMGGVAQARAMARSTHIVSRIAALRQENNLTECQEVETHAHLEIRKIQHSFAPIMCIGTLISLCGLVGIIAASQLGSWLPIPPINHGNRRCHIFAESRFQQNAEAKRTKH